MVPYIGAALAEAVLADTRYREARTTLVTPGIQVESVGSHLSAYDTPLACLSITFADASSRTIMASSYEIQAILNDPDFPKGYSEVRTTLCQASEKAFRFQAAEKERMAREWDEGVEKVKTWVKSGLKRLLPF